MTIKIVVPVSGGKDSQACLKLASQSYQPDEIIGLFCDTQFEHPLTYKHIETIRDLYQVSIMRVCAGSVPEKVKKYGMFPSGTVRFCTDELKIQPSKNFYSDLSKRQGGFEVWYGMRAGESNDRARRYKHIIDSETYAPHDVLAKYPKYLDKQGVKFRLPIIDWSFHDVLEFLGDEINPIYKAGKGIDRVGCFPCLATGAKNQARHFNFDEFGKKQREIVMNLEANIKHDKTNDDLFNGCSFCTI
jgi:3'-phosphoadenosine 5'-phosphosulfate sulfotransferase (PAPS reductase)/FAD synthetase